MYSCVAFLCSLVIFACNQKHTHEFREYNFDRCCSRSGRRRRTQWMANGKQLNYNIRGMFISMSDHTVSVLKRNRHSPSFLLLKFTVPWHKIRRWTWYVRTDLFAHSICWVRFFFSISLLLLRTSCSAQANSSDSDRYGRRMSNWFSFEIADCADWLCVRVQVELAQPIICCNSRCEAVRQQIIEIAKITQLSIFKRLSDCN